MTPTLFVQIAAYRDPDLPATLHNLIERAAHPERLRFGICLQCAATDCPSWGIRSFPNHPHLSIAQFDAAESRGACWARSQAQTLYASEDFLLQIDSHMRAVDHWDEQLLQTWETCADPHAVLSVYPNGFEQPCALNTATLPVMAADHFDQYGILKFKGVSQYRWPEEAPSAPIPGAFIAGGFLFGPGSIVTDVPYDPKLYFYGEEVAMSARLWTHGYNIYAPNRLLLFHLYKTSQTSSDATTAVTHWSDHSDWFKLNRRSLVRVHTLLNSLETAPQSLRPTLDDVDDLNKYWLGDQRTLHHFEQWANVDFRNRQIFKGPKEDAEHNTRQH